MVEVLPELEPELEPEAVIIVRAVPEVGKIAILAVALGTILAVDAVVRAFFGTLTGSVGWIPYLGKVVEAPIHKIEQKVVSFLSGIEHDIDGALGHAIHQTAKLAEQLVKTLENTAVELILIGFLAAGFTANVLLPKLERFVRGAIRKVEEEIRRTERHVIKQGAHITRVTVHNIFPRIKGAEVAIQRVVEHELTPIRKTAHEAERIAVRTQKEVRSLRHRVSNKAILAAVGAAIGTVALDALRCVNFGNLFKKRGCGLWNDLESLLGLFADVLIFANVCAILDFLSPFVSDVAAPIVTALTDVGAGLCRGTIGPPPPLQVPPLSLPKNPGVTLNLP
jgi:hypothetical protein